MPHVRQQIRESAATALTGLPNIANIFQSRVYPMEFTSLPGIIVYTLSESADPITIGSPRLLQRNLNLAIEIYAKLTTDIDDFIDQTCVDVEKALASDAVLKSLTKCVNLSDTDIKLSGDADQPVAVATLTFAVEYATREDNPEAAV